LARTGWGTLVRGAKNGLVTTWELTKIILPVYVLVTLLEGSPVLGWLANRCAPLMQVFDLPGEATIVLTLGYLLNLYAAIGAILSLDLTPAQITVLAVMLGIAHTLILETAIVKKSGLPVVRTLVLRLGTSLIAGLLISTVL